MRARRGGAALLLATLLPGLTAASSASGVQPAGGPKGEAVVARTPRGWIGLQDRWIVEHTGSSSRNLLRLSHTGPEPPSVVSDGERTLLAHDGRLLLVTDGGRTIRALYDAGQGPQEPSGLTLGADAVRWSVGDRHFRLSADNGPVAEIT